MKEMEIFCYNKDDDYDEKCVNENVKRWECSNSLDCLVLRLGHVSRSKIAKITRFLGHFFNKNVFKISRMVMRMVIVAAK